MLLFRDERFMIEIITDTREESMMTKKVFKILVCAVFMVIICAVSAFAADGFTDAEKEKLLTDRSARSALHKTIEMMPLEEFKQYKPVIESAVFYDNAWLDSATTGYNDDELNKILPFSYLIAFLITPSNTSFPVEVILVFAFDTLETFAFFAPFK